MKVLVVEDELEVGTVFRDFLIELGHEPVLARSAEAAVGSLNNAKPDAIILDVHLPGMSGLDFLQLRPIRECGLPIVAVSGIRKDHDGYAFYFVNPTGGEFQRLAASPPGIRIARAKPALERDCFYKFGLALACRFSGVGTGM